MNMTADVDSLERLRDELRDQLAIATAAKTKEDVCRELVDFASKEAEPLSADHPEPNEWHKNPNGGEERFLPLPFLCFLTCLVPVPPGGGCAIL